MMRTRSGPGGSSLKYLLFVRWFYFMNKDEYFITLALDEAMKAYLEDEVPVGCVLVCDGEVIAKGHNTREQEKDIFGHAELNVIKEASKKINNYRFNECTLYVTLEPCPMCASALQQTHIKRIVFGAYDKKNGGCGGLFDLFQIPGLNYYPHITGGVLEEECARLLKQFFVNKRKK